MKKLFTLLAVLVSICAGAQTGLTAEVELALKQQAMAKVDQLTNHFSFISSKKYANDVKDYHVRAALNLFLGGGHDYQDQYGNVLPAPRMQVSKLDRSTGNVTFKEYPVRTYLSNLKYLNYDEVTITNSKSSFISSLQKVSDTEYMAVLSWVQIFVGKQKDMVVYRDRTSKNIVVKMTKKNYAGIERWEVLLGDTTVKVTE